MPDAQNQTVVSEPAVRRVEMLDAPSFEREPQRDLPPLETVPRGEARHIDELIGLLKEKMRREFWSGKTLRGAHSKMHGCLRARFRVDRDCSIKLGASDPEQLGLFAAANEYDAWTRFSNQDGRVNDDDVPDIRAIAIKLLGVRGEKLLDGEEQCQTHDFILISHDAFVTKDVAEFAELIRATMKSALHVMYFFVTHPRGGLNLLRATRKRGALLEHTYFSVVPYLLGTRAVKYALRPAHRVSRAGPRGSGPDHLRKDLQADLKTSAFVFDFLVQFQGDPAHMPVEDPRIAWSEADSPFIKVATLEIPAQTFDYAERNEFGENLSFNPWRCLPQHRPLGGISRARRVIYRALSRFRHERNHVVMQEPEA